MIHQMAWCLVLIGIAAWSNPSSAYQFEQLDGVRLTRMMKGPDLTSKSTLTVDEIGSMPAWLRETRAALILATTDLGNPARLLVVPELRKPSVGQGELIPVVVLERLDTFDASNPSNRLTTRRDLVIFDGFQVDLDTGQVVPEGQGGDLVFRSTGSQGPRLETLGGSRLFTMAKPPSVESARFPQPTPGKHVVPSDFVGRYRLFADGQWSGTLDLKVEGRGVVNGEFRSDLHGTTYPVSGQVAADVSQKVSFAIKYPRARQEFEGYLWAEGKGALAGVASLNERPVGFFAIRDGGKVAPEAADIGPMVAADGDRPGRHVLEILDNRITLDAKPVDSDHLAITIRRLVEADAHPDFWVLVRTSTRRNFGEVMKVMEAVRSAGVRIIRFESGE